MEYLFRLPLRWKKKTADHAAPGQERAQVASAEQMEDLTPAAELPSAAAALAELFPEETPTEEASAPPTPLATVSEEPRTSGTVEDSVPGIGVKRQFSENVDIGASEAETPDEGTTLASELKLPPPELPAILEARDTNDAETKSSNVPITQPAKDWAFEEKLASHVEWVESEGVEGKQAAFSGANLEGIELVGVNLRHADLHGANLKGADLLLTDLRDACLAGANLEEACLVGTNLEGANLEGARLETAMGLLPRQLAGTNLYQATLPRQILEFEALGEFEGASRMAQRLLAVIMPACLVAWLIVWKTKDAQLAANLAVIPFLHSPQASAALPTVQFYSIAPVLLMILYLVFQFHLQRVWDATLELPAVFPDGRKFGFADGRRGTRHASRMLLGLLHKHFRWMNQDANSTRAIEKALAVLVAYWIVPATLVLFWARTLMLGEIHGTVLHLVLLGVSTGVALYSTTHVGRPQEAWGQRQNMWARLLKKLKGTKPAAFAMALGAVLALVSIGTFHGIPHDPRRAPQYGQGDIRRWAPTALWSVGYDPFPDLTEAAVSAKPAGWSGGDQDISSVHGAAMNGANLRYAQAYGIFLANGHLRRADFEGAFMAEADLRGADLGESNLRFADLDGARMYRANLDRAQLEGTNLARADLREANMSYDLLANAILADAQLEGATLYGAQLQSATMVRANLEKADLRESRMDGANLNRADLGQAYLWSAKLPGARLENARLEAALAVDADLSGADLQGAQLTGTVLTGAALDGANLDGADLRGALRLTPSQVCSARSRKGALLDDAMQAEVAAQCGDSTAPTKPIVAPEQ